MQRQGEKGTHLTQMDKLCENRLWSVLQEMHNCSSLILSTVYLCALDARVVNRLLNSLRCPLFTTRGPDENICRKSWHDLVERSLSLERRCKDASSWSLHFIWSKFHFLRRFHFAVHKAPISGSGVTEWSERHRRLTQGRTNTVSDLQSSPASGAVYVPPQGKYLRVSPRSPFKTAYIGVCFS